MAGHQTAVHPSCPHAWPDEGREQKASSQLLAALRTTEEMEVESMEEGAESSRLNRLFIYITRYSSRHAS